AYPLCYILQSVPSAHLISPTHLYPISLHDALPISQLALRRIERTFSSPLICVNPSQVKSRIKSTFESISVNLNIISVSLRQLVRSEEHTSELQSRFDLVCRLLLEKKNQSHTYMTCL